jgi:hypothetical protein
MVKGPVMLAAVRLAAAALATSWLIILAVPVSRCSAV